MKIVIGIESWVNSILHIDTELRSMGHIVVTIHTDEYKYTCSYLQKKIDKIGFHAQHYAYRERITDDFFCCLEVFHPDLILFINHPRHVMNG